MFYEVIFIFLFLIFSIIRFSAVAVYYEKIVLDLLNKISVDIRFKNIEDEYFSYFSTAINKFEQLFKNYNNLIEEVKKVKISEIKQIQSNYRSSIMDFQNLQNNYRSSLMSNNLVSNFNNNNTKPIIINDHRDSRQNSIFSHNSLKCVSNPTKNPTISFSNKRSIFMCQNTFSKNISTLNHLTSPVNKDFRKGKSFLMANPSPNQAVQVDNNLDLESLNIRFNLDKRRKTNNIIKNVNKGFVKKNTFFDNKNISEEKTYNNARTINYKITEDAESENEASSMRSETNDDKSEIKSQTRTSIMSNENFKSCMKSTSNENYENMKSSDKKKPKHNALSYNFDEVANRSAKKIHFGVKDSLVADLSVKNKEKPFNFSKSIEPTPIAKNSLKENQIKGLSLNSNNKNANVKNNKSKSIMGIFPGSNFKDQGKLMPSFSKTIDFDDLNTKEQRKTSNQLSNICHSSTLQRLATIIDNTCTINTGHSRMSYSPSHATNDINEDNEKYINEIKQLKSEVEMYKQYIDSLNNKTQSETKLKSSYIQNVKDFEKNNHAIYKVEIDNIHNCFEIYKEFYQNELDNRKNIIVNLHGTMEEYLSNK